MLQTADAISIGASVIGAHDPVWLKDADGSDRTLTDEWMVQAMRHTPRVGAFASPSSARDGVACYDLTEGGISI